MQITQSIKTIFLSVLGLLLIPLVAMQFSTEVNWSFFDFIVVGTMLFSLGLTLNFIIKKIKSQKLKLALLVLTLIAFLLLWIELAVGIFNSPFAGT